MIRITAADRYFSLCVRKRANWSCERCHVAYSPTPTQALHCSHFMSRGNWGTRFDPPNASSLCMGCHLYLGGRPSEHMAWMTERLGEPEIERLRRLAKAPAYGIKKRLREIAKHYRDQYERMRLGGHFSAYADASKRGELPEGVG